jgi:hypothetical protein
MYPVVVILTEAIGWHDSQNSVPRLLLHELELPYTQKRIIVHIQSRP